MLKKIALIFFALATLTGCYDNKETDTLATVMAVGVDVSDSNKEYTFAVADTGGYSGESKGDSASLICFSQQAQSIDDAVEALDRKLSKKLSFLHLSALIFSESAAEKDVYPEVKYFEKKISVRPQTMLAVADISPKKYLENLKPDLESNPEKYFQNILDRNESYVSTLRICDFTNSYHSKTVVSAPVIKGAKEADKLSEEKTFVSGSTLLYNGKEISKIENNWFMGLILSKKSVKHNGISLRSVKKPRINVDTNKDAPIINIDLYVKSDGKISKNTIGKQLEKELSEYAGKGIDVINASEHARKSFLLQKKYEQYGFDIKKASFEINVMLYSQLENLRIK